MDRIEDETIRYLFFLQIAAGGLVRMAKAAVAGPWAGQSHAAVCS